MKKFAYIIIVLGLCLIINSLIHSIYDLWHKQDLVINAQKQLAQEQSKNQKLKTQYKYAQTTQFLEQQARDKLFLVKPGEEQVLISQKKLSEQQKADNTPNWQKWLQLFF